MFPLVDATLPASPDTLVEALRAGFAAQGIQPAALSAQGGWPQLSALTCDLTGISLDAIPSLPRSDADRDGSFSATEFTLRAAPARFRGAPVEVAITAREAAFAIADDPSAPPCVVLTGAAEGRIAVSATLAALEQAVQRLAADAAREHGVEVKATRLQITQRGPRAISLRAEVTAKAFIATASITLSGDVDLDEEFNARISNLQMTGNGMIANLAGGVIQPILARFEGKSLSLLSLARGLPLRDVQVEVGETLRIAAQFGR